MSFAAPIPILRSFDEAKTRAFYCDFLGFTVDFEHRFEPGAPLYLGLRCGDCVLHLSEHFGDAAPGAALRIEVPDVHAFVSALNAKQYRHSRPGAAERKSWGSDDITIDDPNGNRLTFYTWTNGDGAS